MLLALFCSLLFEYQMLMHLRLRVTWYELNFRWSTLCSLKMGGHCRFSYLELWGIIVNLPTSSLITTFSCLGSIDCVAPHFLTLENTSGLITHRLGLIITLWNSHVLYNVILVMGSYAHATFFVFTFIKEYGTNESKSIFRPIIWQCILIKRVLIIFPCLEILNLAERNYLIRLIFWHL